MLANGLELSPDAAVVVRTETIAIVEPVRDWDAFVETAPGGDLVQTSMWGLSKRAIGQTPLLVLQRMPDGTIVAGAMIVERWVGPGIRIGYVARGPVTRADSSRSLTSILDAVIGVARERRLAGLIVQLPEVDGDDDGEAVLQASGFIPGSLGVAPEATIRIDLTQSDDAIRAAMSQMRRRNLKKSANEGLTIQQSDDVAGFHRLHMATSDRKGFTALSLEYLNAQWQALAAVGALTILLALFEGQPVAGLWLSLFGDVATFRLAGWNPEANAPRHVNEALHWAAILWAKAHGAKVYDFGGFDRGCAERILAGRLLPENFEKSHNFFKLGFYGTPTLLPKASFLLLNRTANRAARAFGPRLMRTDVVRNFGQRLRSG